MPLLKSEDLRLSAEEVAALRARLTEPDRFEIVDEDGARYLFVRCAAAEPHPVADLERALDFVPAWVLTGLTDVFLLGARQDLHVPGHIAQPVLRNRLRFDDAVARDARALLDVQYGIAVRRYPADPHNMERLLARVPRGACSDLVEADLVQLARAIGPLFDTGALRNVRSCHLVADQDHVRIRPDDFLGDLVERWRAAPAPAPALAAQSAPAEAEPAPPRRVIDVTPVFELEVELEALPADAPGPDELARAVHTIADALDTAGFRIEWDSGTGGESIAFRASRARGFPRSLAIHVAARLGRAEAESALQIVRAHELDLLVVITADASEEALRRLALSRVKVLKPDQVADFRP